MGVYYSLGAVRKKKWSLFQLFGKPKYEEVYGGEPSYSTKAFSDLLDFQEVLEKTVGHKLNLSFIQRGDDEEVIVSPHKVLKIVQEIAEAMKNHSSKLPKRYFVDHPKGLSRTFPTAESYNFYLKGKLVRIYTDWDKCHYFPISQSELYIGEHVEALRKRKKVFIGNKKSIKVQLAMRTAGKEGVKPGPMVNLLIHKRTMYEYFKDFIEHLVDVCEYAIKNDLEVHGTIS